jgi:hypothetical protein
MGVSGGPNAIQDGLVLVLDASDRNSYVTGSTTWLDISGTGGVDTLTNCGFDSANGGAITFNPLVSGSSAINHVSQSLNQITVNVWYYSNETTSQALTRANGGGVNNCFLLHYRGAGFYLVGSDNVASGYLGWDTAPASLRWNMLTGTWDGATMKLYTNGVKQASELAFAGGPSNILKSFNLTQLGYYFNSFQPYTNGRIANFALYNRALTQAQVLQNYNATKTRFGLT